MQLSQNPVTDDINESGNCMSETLVGHTANCEDEKVQHSCLAWLAQFSKDKCSNKDYMFRVPVLFHLTFLRALPTLFLLLDCYYWQNVIVVIFGIRKTANKSDRRMWEGDKANY